MLIWACSKFLVDQSDCLVENTCRIMVLKARQQVVLVIKWSLYVLSACWRWTEDRSCSVIWRHSTETTLFHLHHIWSTGSAMINKHDAESSNCCTCPLYEPSASKQSLGHKENWHWLFCQAPRRLHKRWGHLWRGTFLRTAGPKSNYRLQSTCRDGLRQKVENIKLWGFNRRNI